MGTTAGPFLAGVGGVLRQTALPFGLSAAACVAVALCLLEAAGQLRITVSRHVAAILALPLFFPPVLLTQLVVAWCDDHFHSAARGSPLLLGIFGFVFH